MGKLLKRLARAGQLVGMDADTIEKVIEADEISRKRAAKDDEDSGWRTLEGGTKVHFSEGGGGGTGGKIDKGPSNMKGKTMGQVKAEGKAQTAARRAAKAAAKPAAAKPASGAAKSGGAESNEAGRRSSKKQEAMRNKLHNIAWQYKAYGPDYPGERKELLEKWNDNVSKARAAGISHEEMNEIFHNPNVNIALRQFREPSGVAYDPQRTGSETPRKLSKAAKQNLDRVSSACREASAMCKEKAKQWPADSEEREIYERYEGIMSKPQAGRPTEAESKALTKKFLGNISSKLKPYAVEKYKKDLANEPKITNDLCDIADDIGTEMFGLEYRLKKASDSSDGGCRVAEKIAETMAKKRADGTYPTYEEAADNLSDLVRYTQACTTDNLVENFEKTQKALEEKGYKTVKVKNTWDSYSIQNAYRGVNCVFESPTGTRFELQFHTPESLVGKEVQHPQYEEQRKPETAQKRKDELGNIMYNNMSGLKRPRNIERIKNSP